MEKQEEKPGQETLRKEKLKAEEARLLARDQERSQVYLARERKIEEGRNIKESQRAKDRAAEEIRELAKEKARKEAYLAREKRIAEEQEARKLKNQKTV